MIPLSCKDKVSHIDGAITWHYKPKTGFLEREILTLNESLSSDLPRDQYLDILDKIIDSILIGWEDKAGKMPSFPPDNKPGRIFNTSEKWVLLGFWNEANKLSVEEKKL
jgi:hypothetical protein